MKYRGGTVHGSRREFLKGFGRVASLYLGFGVSGCIGRGDGAILLVDSSILS